ncbi:acyltransferase [Bradyrhizobium sp. RT3b]|uniref:acyltransferase family protein n=1 Tax=Bradyrhizobium sp. RT3b TaxID=3156334 RepID=UPI00339506C0
MATQRLDYPNFNLIRLIAASSVIFSHAFLIANGDENAEPLVKILGEGNILGIYGVFTFFFISGFLVTLSLLNSPSVLNYFWRRFLRIYPALAVCLAISAFVIGPIFSSKSTVSFFTSSEGIRYFLGNLWWPGKPPGMPSVTLYDEPSGWLGGMINGSLWTIFHELACYVLLGLLGLFGALNAGVLVLICVSMVLISVVGVTPNSATIGDFFLVAPAFFAGAAFSALKLQDKDPIFRIASMVAALLTLCVAYRYNAMLQIFPLAGAPVILLIATSQRLNLPTLRQVGDVSFGTYLYGWPAEQLMRAGVGPDASWSLIFFGSLSAAYLAGYLSWWAIERPALRYKTAPWKIPPP